MSVQSTVGFGVRQMKKLLKLNRRHKFAVIRKIDGKRPWMMMTITMMIITEIEKGKRRICIVVEIALRKLKCL